MTDVYEPADELERLEPFRERTVGCIELNRGKLTVGPFKAMDCRTDGWMIKRWSTNGGFNEGVHIGDNDETTDSWTDKCTGHIQLIGQTY